MPRFFRCHLENAMQGYSLQLEKKADPPHGSWSPGGWQPPESIASGQTGHWQTQNDWFMSGTSGWVQYRIKQDADGGAVGLVVIYWTNPYIGVTHEHRAIYGHSALVDGNGEPDRWVADGENARPSSLFLDVTSVGINGDPASYEDLEDYLRPDPAPLRLLTSGVWERMEVSYRLRSTAPPPMVFPGPRPKTTGVETNPAPSVFVGTWRGPNVQITFALVGARRFHVKVNDHTQPEALEFEAEAELDLSGALRALERGAALAGNEANLGRHNALQRIAVTADLGNSLRRQEAATAGRPDWMLARVAVHGLAEQRRQLNPRRVWEVGESAGIARHPEFDPVAAAIAERARSASYILNLRYDVAVFLIKTEEEGQVVDYQLQYQRVGPLGVPLARVVLNYELPIH
ncbi:MAG: hypothetical protein U1E21_18490 [Reyranellaceae bacterium]